MKAHRQYVREQIKKDRRFGQDIEDARVQVRFAVTIARLREAEHPSRKMGQEATS